MRLYSTENTTSSDDTPVRFRHTSGDISSTFPTVAVLLSGCGFLDGSDCLETSALNIQLLGYGIRPVFYAPSNAEIGLVYNHSTKNSDPNEERWAFKEALRLGRVVAPLTELNSNEHLALIIPGGDGSIMTLSDIFTSHEDLSWGKVNAEAENAVKNFHTSKKPIVSLGNASVFVAQILGTLRKGPGVTITTGRDHGDWIRKVGSTFEDSEGIVVDKENAIISCGGVTDSRISQSPDIVFERCGDIIGILKNNYLTNFENIYNGRYNDLKKPTSPKKSE